MSISIMLLMTLIGFHSAIVILGEHDESDARFSGSNPSRVRESTSSHGFGATALQNLADTTQRTHDSQGPIIRQLSQSGNIALGKTASSSSVEDPFTPDKAFDGDAGTRWSSLATDDEWVAVDLGAVHAIRRVEITWEGACAASYKLQGSSDGATWTDMASRSGLTSPTCIDPPHDIPSGHEYRHVRMLGLTRATQYGYSIFEMAIYENEAATVAGTTTSTADTSSEAGYTFQGVGAADPSKWSVNPNGLQAGVESCYQAVMADPDCAKDYFTYATRGDGNCGCKRAEALTFRADVNTDYYRIEAEFSSTTMEVTTTTSNEASITWMIPMNPQTKSVSVGTEVVFTWGGIHNVYELTTLADYDHCDTTGGTMIGSISGTKVTMASEGTRYFICEVPGHCDAGQKIAITATAVLSMETCEWKSLGGLRFHEGGELGGEPVGTGLEGCKSACDATTGCMSFSFMAADGVCYKKDQIVQASDNFNTGGAFVTYYKQCQAVTSTSLAATTTASTFMATSLAVATSGITSTMASPSPPSPPVHPVTSCSGLIATNVCDVPFAQCATLSGEQTCAQVHVYGTLIIQSGSTLHTPSVHVHEEGVLIVGTSNSPVDNVEIDLQENGVLFSEGYTYIYGQPKTSWTLLTAECDNCKTITVASCDGWEVGDSLVLVGQGDGANGQVQANNQYRTDELTIESINGCSITLNQNVGQRLRNEVYKSIVPIKSEVLNMERSVHIYGTNVTTRQHFTGFMQAHYARISNCGKLMEGEYCLHWHHLGDCPECSFVGNAVGWPSTNKGIVVHGTSHALVEGNIVYKHMGAFLYVEDGNEIGNLIKDNALICPTVQGCKLKNGEPKHLASDDGEQGGMYIVSVTNDFIGNHIAGMENAIFQDFQSGRKVWGDPDSPQSFKKVCPTANPWGRVSDNYLHNNAGFGFYSPHSSYPTRVSVDSEGLVADWNSCLGFDPSTGADNSAAYTVENHVELWHNFGAGGYDGGETSFKNAIFAFGLASNYYKTFRRGIRSGPLCEGCFYIDSLYPNTPGGACMWEYKDTAFEGIGVLQVNHHCGNDGEWTGGLCASHIMFTGSSEWKGTPFNLNNDGFGGCQKYSDSVVYYSGKTYFGTSFSHPAFRTNQCEVVLMNSGNKWTACSYDIRIVRIYSANRGNLTVINNDEGYTQTVSYTPWVKSTVWSRPNVYDLLTKYQNGGMGYTFLVKAGQSYTLEVGEGIEPDFFTLEYSDPQMPEDSIVLNVAGSGLIAGGPCTIQSTHDRNWITPYGPYIPESGAWWNCQKWGVNYTQQQHEEAQRKHFHDTGLQVPFIFGDVGIAGPVKWNVSSLVGIGVESCYRAVLADPECAKDYFTYVARGNQSCGCKTSGTLTIRSDDTSDYYKIQANNLALGLSGSASSVMATNTPSLAFDGNPGTRWESVFTDDQWLAVDLGAPYSIGSIEIRWEGACAASYELQGSLDGATWTVMASRSGLTSPACLTDPPVDLPPDTVYQHVRIVGLTRATGFGYSIYEMAINEKVGDLTTSIAATTTALAIEATTTQAEATTTSASTTASTTSAPNQAPNTQSCCNELAPDNVPMDEFTACQAAMHFGKYDGIVNHPEWYVGTGMTTMSSWNDWQMYISSQSDPQGCLPPCTTSTSCASTTQAVATTTSASNMATITATSSQAACQWNSLPGLAVSEGGGVGTDTFNGAGLEGCKSGCDATLGCMSFSYMSSSLTCYLKDAIIQADDEYSTLTPFITHYKQCQAESSSTSSSTSIAATTITSAIATTTTSQPPQVAYTFQGIGTADPAKWSVNANGLGAGVESCYQAVMDDPDCVKDYFFYAARGDGNCGCKTLGTLAFRDDTATDYYKIQVEFSSTSIAATTITSASIAGTTNSQPPQAGSTSTSMSSTPTTIGTCQWNSLPGVRLVEGAAAGSRPDGTGLDVCKSVCDAMVECMSLAYNTESGACYLKKQIVQASDESKLGSFITHYKQCQAEASSTSPPAQACTDNNDFLDQHGYTCRDWHGYDCTSGVRYTQQGENDLINNCSLTCGLCQTLYTFQAIGVADPTKWSIDEAPGKGTDSCYHAVMSDPDCTKDYFSYAERGDKNCGCKRQGYFSHRSDAPTDYYKIEVQLCRKGYYYDEGTLPVASCKAWGCNTTGGVGCASCVPQASRTSATTCATCNSGYFLSGGSCQAWGCTTTVGSGCASCVTQASRASATTCATCNSGYFLSGGSCQAPSETLASSTTLVSTALASSTTLTSASVVATTFTDASLPTGTQAAWTTTSSGLMKSCDPELSNMGSFAVLHRVSGSIAFSSAGDLGKFHVEDSVKAALALNLEVCEVVIDVNAKSTRRLGMESRSRKLLTSSEWSVDYNVTLPNEQEANQVHQKATQMRAYPLAFSNDVMDKLRGLGLPPDKAQISVGEITPPVKTIVRQDQGAVQDASNADLDDTDDSSSPLIIVIAVSSAIFCCIGVALVMYIRRARMKQRAPRIPELPEGRTFHYFLSHKKTHSVHGNCSEYLSLYLHDALKVIGWKGFFDLDSLKRITQEELTDHVKKSCVMIVVVNNETCLSEWCRLEWEVAEEHGIPVICVLDLRLFLKSDVLNHVTASSPYLLQNQWIVYTDRNRQQAVDDCSQWLHDIMRDYSSIMLHPTSSCHGHNSKLSKRTISTIIQCVTTGGSLRKPTKCDSSASRPERSCSRSWTSKSAEDSFLVEAANTLAVQNSETCQESRSSAEQTREEDAFTVKCVDLDMQLPDLGVIEDMSTQRERPVLMYGLPAPPKASDFPRKFSL